MNAYKSAILLILTGISLLEAMVSDSMKYVVFNGESCKNPGDFGPACDEYKNTGVLEVVRVQTGVYIVYFDEPFTNNDYAVLTSSNLQETGGAYTSVGGNDDNLNAYYGVSRYFVRISTRKLGSSQEAADSDYISVVANPQFGMTKVVFDGEDCTGGETGDECTVLNTLVGGQHKVYKIAVGFYEAYFSRPKPDTHYAVLGSSNVWGTGGAITSIGGNTKGGSKYEGVTTQGVQIDTRIMSTNSRSPSDYISIVAGYPSRNGIKYAVFDGSDCTGDGVFGATCTIFSSLGVQEIIRDAAGSYKIYWNTEFNNNNYVVLCDSNVYGPGGTVCGLGGNNVGSSTAHGVSVVFVEIQTRKMHQNDRSDSNFISILAFDS